MIPLNAVRLSLGTAHLLVPSLGRRLVPHQEIDWGARRVVQVLGARQIVQTLLTSHGANRAVLVSGRRSRYRPCPLDDWVGDHESAVGDGWPWSRLPWAVGWPRSVGVSPKRWLQVPRLHASRSGPGASESVGRPSGSRLGSRISTALCSDEFEVQGTQPSRTCSVQIR